MVASRARTGCVPSPLSVAAQVAARPSRVSVDEIAAAYERLGSVWAVGRELGISGQAVSERMRSTGIATNKRFLTDADRDVIRSYYTATLSSDFSLLYLAETLRRSKSTISREARALGLSSPSRKKSAATISKMEERNWEGKEHPRGMLGKKHTKSALEKVSAASKKTWATWKAFGIGQMSQKGREEASARAAKRNALISSENRYSRSHGAHRADLGGVFFRSSWEANYARYLNLLQRMKIVEVWEFEPRTFWFDGVKRGVISYLPDFCVKYRNDPVPEYVEIKGWVTPKDRTKWKRMAKYHPDVKLTIVREKEYLSIQNKWSGAIPEWERGKTAVYRRLMGRRV